MIPIPKTIPNPGRAAAFMEAANILDCEYRIMGKKINPQKVIDVLRRCAEQEGYIK